MSQQKVQTFNSINFSRTILMAFLGEVTFDKKGVSTQAYDEKLVDQACDAYDDLAAVFEEDLNSGNQDDDLSKSPLIDPLEKETDEDHLEDPSVKRIEGTEEETEEELGEGEQIGDGVEETEESEELDEPAMTKEEAEALLEGKSLEELRTIASDSGFPEGEWKSFRAAKNLTSYLVGKLTATQA